MDNNNGSMICALTCWGIALLAGAVTMALLMVLGGWMFIQGVFMGALVFVFGGALISWLLCRPLPPLGAVEAPGASATETAEPTEKAQAAPAAAAAAPAAAAPAAAAPAAAATGPAVKPSARLAGQEELAGRQSEWKYEAQAEEGKKAAATPTPAKASAAASKEDDVQQSEPETLSAARGGKPDDLKLLKGVGPKLEGTLNELGFYHFDQVASWTDEHVAWVDSRLKFKGRIERDGWIEQAKILAAGGETEFSKRNK